MSQEKIERLIAEIKADYEKDFIEGRIYTPKVKSDLVEKFRDAINAPKVVMPKSIGLSRGRGTKPPL